MANPFTRTATIGESVAEWLVRRVDPARVYDHLIMLELNDVGIYYDPATTIIWMQTGEMADVPTYTPAELVRHPIVEIAGMSDTMPDHCVLGFEIAAALHHLLWPAEQPPGEPYEGWQAAFDADVKSITARDTMPYRDNPPGGWWHG